MIVWGTLVSQPRLQARRGARLAYALCATGIGLALYVFMADAIAAAPRGADAVRSVLPTAFNWTLFLVALALMAAPIAAIISDRRSGTAA
jgi:uncharacterized membrane protein